MPTSASLQVDRELANLLQTLSIEREHLAVLSQSASSRLLESEVPSVPVRPLDVKIGRNRILSEDWEKVVERVWTIEGFNNF